jgi:hypothetical protein
VRDLSTRCMEREQQGIGRRCALMIGREVDHHRGVRSGCFEAIGGDADDFFDAEVGRADIVAIDLCMHPANVNGKSLNNALRLYLQTIDPSHRRRCGGRSAGGLNSRPY